jgi:hypothetical protein
MDTYKLRESYTNYTMVENRNLFKYDIKLEYGPGLLELSKDYSYIIYDKTKMLLKPKGKVYFGQNPNNINEKSNKVLLCCDNQNDMAGRDDTVYYMFNARFDDFYIIMKLDKTVTPNEYKFSHILYNSKEFR